ncbi:MAG: hypothetical protein V3W31_02355, partial [Thermodesulfobacteriota bacterium]
GGEYFLLVPLALIAVLTLRSSLNIGLRHILPAYPFLIVLASSVITLRFGRPVIAKAAFATFSVWYAVSTLSIFPSYLAYFNEFVGPDRGYRYLVDSNLDWGQDLKRLKKYMDKNGVEEVYLSYFGTADPAYYGIGCRELMGTLRACKYKRSGVPRFLAVSATNLQAVYMPDKHTFDWLKKREPAARIGYSIFVYDLSGDALAYNGIGGTILKIEELSRLQPEELREALLAFEEAVRLKPGEPVLHANLGITYALLSEDRRARRELTAAMSMDPASSEAYTGMGILYLNRGLKFQAMSAFKRALVLDPDNHMAKRRLDALMRR